MAFEIRVPRGMALARLRPAAARVLRPAPSGLHVRLGTDRRHLAAVPAEDVEREVRERLYGRRRGLS